MKIEQLITQYMSSHRYKKLAESSERSYRYALDQIAKHLKDKDISDIKRSDMIRIQTEMEDRPGAANLIVRIASILFDYALDMDMIPHNPALAVKKLKCGSHEKWEPAEVRKAIAMNDRKISVAIALAWYTGQRESDILSMRWSDFDGKYITVVQKKTGVEMKIKAHPDLIRILDGIRDGAPDEHYIVSGAKIFSGPAFRNMFVRRMRSLGIKKTFHGIRKGVASSLAETGSSINEIAAILGHKTLRMAAYYAEQASSKKMTESAVDQLTSCA